MSVGVDLIALLGSRRVGNDMRSALSSKFCDMGWCIVTLDMGEVRLSNACAIYCSATRATLLRREAAAGPCHDDGVRRSPSATGQIMSAERHSRDMVHTLAVDIWRSSGLILVVRARCQLVEKRRP